MAAAADVYVDMHELAGAVADRLAELTRNEAALVTAGAAAGLMLGAWACMSGDDEAAIARADDQGATSFTTNEIVVQCSQQNPYVVVLRTAGARIVEVGDADGTRPEQLDAALGEHTAAVLHVMNSDWGHGAIGLDAVVTHAHERGIPVIVDAAAQLPPVSNLWDLTARGADIVLFSAGKGMRGPAGAGLAVGRPRLLRAMAMYASPHQRLGRALKLSKEELVGTLAAVEWLLGADEDAERARVEAISAWWVAELARLPGVVAERVFPGEAGRPLPRVRVAFDAGSGLGGPRTRATLLDGDPRVAVAADGDRGLLLNAETLAAGQEQVVLDAIRALVLPRVAP